jgi:hypothetical protein
VGHDLFHAAHGFDPAALLFRIDRSGGVIHRLLLRSINAGIKASP